MSEEELITRLRNKDREGFRYMMQYYPMCQQMMRNYGVDEESCEDIFQESQIVLFENLQKKDFQLTAKASTYLYSVCQNKVREYGRKKNKTEVAMPSEAVNDPDAVRYHSPEQNYDPYAEFEDELPSSEALYDAVIALGSPCQEILFMFYYHKSRIKQITQEQGYPNDNATRQAKDRCVKRLKNKFLSKP